MQERQPEQQLLCARALWLIGVCGTDLPNEHWAAAYPLLVQYMAVPDLVLSLTALGAVLAMTAVVLEEASALEQAEDAVLHMQRQIQRVRQLQQQAQQQGREGAREVGGLLREMPWPQERFLQEQEQDLQVLAAICTVLGDLNSRSLPNSLTAVDEPASFNNVCHLSVSVCFDVSPSQLTTVK